MLYREISSYCWNNSVQSLTFVGPCIVIYSYSKTNQMRNISNLFYFGTTLYMFRTLSPSIIRSLKLCIQHKVYVKQVLLARGESLVPASKQPQNLYDIPNAVCTLLDSWWWTERPSETCRVLFQNKINLRYCASGWFYYRNSVLSIWHFRSSELSHFVDDCIFTDVSVNTLPLNSRCKIEEVFLSITIITVYTVVQCCKP